MYEFAGNNSGVDGISRGSFGYVRDCWGKLRVCKGFVGETSGMYGIGGGNFGVKTGLDLNFLVCETLKPVLCTKVSVLDLSQRCQRVQQS